MKHLADHTAEDLAAWASGQGASPEGARALARTLVSRFAGRTSDALASRRLVALAEETFAVDVPDALPAPDPDGTIRFAVRYADGALVEAVAIAHADRSTICLSSQVGCARGCVFCETGRLGLSRQLSAAEIVQQFAVVTRHLDGLGRARPTNVVFMGMGEPFDNLDAVLQASAVLADDCGFRVPARRITVSTVGVVPKLAAFWKNGRYRLAVSLHAANDEDRKALLPVARTWPLSELKAALRDAPETVLLQWTLISGRNDDARHADELIAFAAGLDVRVNLIPLNPGPEDALSAPSPERVQGFQKRLRDAGIRALIRAPHGQSVGGACGQLAGEFRDTPELKPRLPVIGRRRTETLR